MKNNIRRMVSIVLCFILCCSLFVTASAASFSQRTTVPGTNSLYYYSKSYNPFYTNTLWTWCTWYAFGRAYEILGTKPDLSPNSASEWFRYNKSRFDSKKGGYPYSTAYNKAKVGAIACYSGHVQVVEAVAADGTPSAVSTGGFDASKGGSKIETFTKKDYEQTGLKFQYGKDYSKASFVGYIYVLDASLAVPVTSVSINSSDFCIDIGAKAPLTATVSPSKATNKTVIWSSSNPSVVSVSSGGVVTGVSVGKATVTATSGGKKSTVNIQVLAVPPSFSAIGVRNITAKNAVPYCTIKYTGARPSSAGLYLGTSSSSLSKVASDKITFSNNPFKVWYDINTEAKKTLPSKTIHYYRFYVIINGKEYQSGIMSFKTA